MKYKPDNKKKYSEIAIVDIGIISKGLELDYGRTFGRTEEALKLIKDTDNAISQFKSLLKTKIMSPKDAYKTLIKIAENNAVSQIAETAGHIIGKFPTKKSKIKIKESEEAETFSPGSWMIEVHLSNGIIGSLREDIIFLNQEKPG